MTAVLALLLACGGEPADDAELSPYLADEDPVTLPDWDAEAVSSALDDVVGALHALHGGVVPAAWQAAFEGADDDCPTWYSGTDGDYWYDNCTASSGNGFDGYGIYYDFDGTLWSDGNAWVGSGVYGFATLTDADGAALHLSGTALAVTAEQDGYVQHYSGVDGAFSRDGDDGTWLTEGPESGLVMYGYELTTTGARAFTVTGGVSGLSGAVETVVFEDMLIGNDIAGSPCPEEPSGSLSVRDAEGRWIDVLFDLDYSEDGGLVLQDEGACDGCGAAWYDGEPLGELCLDWSGVMSWGEAGPWE